jgi:cobalt-zinc-cadmium efflux system membrane fusion protein
MMRIGMFASATFFGKQPQTHTAIPASAILHLHDREWVYMPFGSGHFKRTEVATGRMLPDKLQEVISGLKPGDQVVSNALDLQNTVEQ